MLNLRELVKEIQINYPNNKFVYRGERKKYGTIESTSSRNTIFKSFPKPVQDEIYKVLTGHNPKIGIKYESSRVSLYYFLREALYDVGIIDNYSNLNLESQLFGVLQHYGFPTAFIDFTHDIKVAAYFASANGVAGSVGRMTILPKENVENLLFDSRLSPAKRPFNQSAMFLLLPDEYDLLSNHFSSTYGAIFLEFCLSEDDKKEFENFNLLSITDGQTANFIVEWYNTHVETNPDIDQEVKDYFKSFVDELS